MPEFDLIARYFAPLARHPAARGLRDDAAVLPPLPAGHSLVITKDMIAAGVHFRNDTPAHIVGGWLLAVNLSDLAAMGAVPLGCVLGLGLPRDVMETWVADFATGLGQAGQLHHCPLLGGDTISGLDRPVLSLTAFGTVPEGASLGRGGAQAGDLVVVSGEIGAAGWRLANQLPVALPDPRLALGQRLRGLASACADVSDGLLADAGHLAAASGLAVEIDLAAVPIDSRWPGDDAARLAAASAGDDYELVFAVPPAARGQLLTLEQQLGLKLTVIGQFGNGSGVVARSADGRRLTPARLGYEHG